ncbi:MAG TPA: terminase gpA endonuclease subunit [Armatimonadota bacterium]|nr:terminase gpA endonuclease subunit [Armatimonadota bacterium]
MAQLTAEKRVTRYTGGTRHNAWVPKRKGLRNEAWDLLVYGLAAILIFGPQALEAAAAQEQTQKTPLAGNAPVTAPRGRRVLSAGVG